MLGGKTNKVFIGNANIVIDFFDTNTAFVYCIKLSFINLLRC